MLHQSTDLLLLTLLTLSPAPALAQDESLDIELAPFATSTAHGLPEGGVVQGRPGDTTVVLLAQYAQRPLAIATSVYDAPELVGRSVRIADRVHTSLGVETVLSRWLAVRVAVPQSTDRLLHRGDHQRWRAGLGDPAVYLASPLLYREDLSLTAVAGARIPLGRGRAWMGEPTRRLHLGMPMALDRGAWSLQVAPGVDLGKDPTVATWSQHLASTLSLDSALRVQIRDRVHLVLGEQFRSSLGGPRGTRAALEARAGVAVELEPGFGLSAGLGTGILRGYGASALRAWLGMHARFADRAPRARPPASPPPPPSEPTPVAPPPPPDPVADALDDDGVLDFSASIRFARGSATLAPGSDQVLDGAAAWLLEHRRADVVLLEGHASTEGSHAFNDDLALRRAQAVFRALVLRGVHPDRLAVRSAGEVDPPAPGQAERRQVSLRILRLLHALEEPPDYPASYVLPWSGERHSPEAP